MINFELDNDDYKILKILNIKPTTFQEILNKIKITNEKLKFRLEYLSNKNFNSTKSNSKVSLIKKEIIGKEPDKFYNGIYIIGRPKFSDKFTLTDTGKVYYQYNKDIRKHRYIKFGLMLLKKMFNLPSAD